MEIANRSVLRGQVTKIVKSAIEYLNSSENQIKDENVDKFEAIEEDLVVFIERLKVAKEGLDASNVAIAVTLKTEDYVKECEGIAEYTDKAISVLARLEQRLKKLKQRQSSADTSNEIPNNPNDNNQRGTSSIKLPKLTLLKFSGEHKDWLPFWEQYRTAIHENSALNESEKFNYLKSLLSGKAAESIAGFTPTQNCYNAAIALLIEEYGDTEKIIDKNVQQLMSLSPVSSRYDVVGLRRLYNVVMCSSRSLTALHVPPSHYFILLKSVLLKCVPHELRLEFYRHQDTHAEEKSTKVDSDKESVCSLSSSSVDFGDTTVKGILSFLKREVESLEKAGTSKRLSSSSSPKAHLTTAGLLTPAKFECYFCKSTEHTTQRCNNSFLTVVQRKELLRREGRCFRCTRKGHNSRDCPNQSNIRCNSCNGKHATSICEKGTKEKVKPDLNASTKQFTANLCSAASIETKTVYLQTACVLASAASGEVKNSLLIRIILDGGSQRSYIREEIVKKLGLNVIDTVEMRILPFGSSSSKKSPTRSFKRVRVALKSQYDNRFVSFLAIVVPEICADVLVAPSGKSSFFANYVLADSYGLLEPEKGISVLIGADIYWSVVLRNFVNLSDNLVAIETVFGWTIQGPSVEAIVEESSTSAISAAVLHSCTFTESDCENFWKLETIGISADKEEIKYSDFSDYIRKGEERYECSLLWKNVGIGIENHRSGALKRFERLVRKLTTDRDKFMEYDKAMWELISTGVAERINEDTNLVNSNYYMPHRPVYRSDKTTTPLRIVFDASARTGHNLSLNEHLHKGPNLLPDVLSILLNFRVGRIALVADIEKAFLQLSLVEKDRDAHRFFWFERRVDNPCDLPKVAVFRMTRVTFGIACSPFLLCGTLRKHFDIESKDFTSTCELLMRSFYMDDLILSVEDLDFAIQFYKETRQIIKRASMNIRKWTSNNSRLIAKFEEKLEPPPTQKVLGLIWNRFPDEVVVDLERTRKMTSVNSTKRNILQLLATIYDPLGILGPFTVKLKLLFQETWRLNVGWDETIPSNLQTIWNQCHTSLEDLTDVALPRYIFKPFPARVSQQLHVFCDSSLSAYGAVAYVRSRYVDDSIHVSYLCAKNRIAPLKCNTNELTLPKLELTAALIAARLSHYIQKHLNLRFESTYLWSDSKITLYWITNDKRKYQPYVINRVREIRQLTAATNWNHCPGSDNPADLLTRGINGKTLTSSPIWFSGPQWLSDSVDDWPQSDINVGNCDNLLCLQVAVTKEEALPITPLFNLKKFSGYNRVLRVTAYVLRFITHLKKKQVQSDHLTAQELEYAEMLWLKCIQSAAFKDEVKALRSLKEIPKSSHILTLNVIMDEDGILRVGSRLAKADLGYNECFPIILPTHSYLTKLLIKEAHERSLHSGVNATLARVREKYWIIKARPAVKAVVKSCIICQRYRGKPASQPFAPLPRERLSASRPFETTGLDFAGPLYVQAAKGSGTTKVYILLLTCSVVRAVHLELVNGLDTESCLSALRRFFARRGIPRTIISDNARTFKRASLELRQLGDIIYSEEIQGFAANSGVLWKFIVERAPWWGGFWERLVKSVKDVLKTTIGKAILNFDQLYTLLAEAEQVINARPLTYISDDPLDLSPLTPAHFLLGVYPSSVATGFGVISDTKIREKWRARLKLSSAFFRRFKTEYLQRLRSAHHSNFRFSSDVRIGDVVIVQDQSAPRHLWKLARIENVFPGRDGKVRACEVRFHNGSRMRRPVQLLYPLEVNSSSPAGGCEKLHEASGNP